MPARFLLSSCLYPALPITLAGTEVLEFYNNLWELGTE